MRFTNSIKALFAAVSGTALHWYDFALFGYFAPIIAANYFPKTTPLAGLINTFGIFAVGYLLAPLGSIFFGYIGDRFGRKRALTISILLIAFPTTLIGLTPGYQSIGIAAPIIITLLRIMQGFSASGEFPGSAIFLVEHASEQHKAFYGCLTSAAYSCGLLLASLSASFFTASFMPDWGWRMGFSLALVAGLLIFFLRTCVMETPEYQQLDPQKKPAFPFKTALKESPYLMLGVMGIAWTSSIVVFGTFVFCASYLHTYFKLPLSQTTLFVSLALAVDAVLEPFLAMLADRVGYLKIIACGFIAILVSSFPVFYLLSSQQIPWIMVAMVILGCVIAITYAPLNAYMTQLFPKHYRYSGVGFAFHFSNSLFGGTTPLVMMWLIQSTGNLLAPACYYVFGALIGLCALIICEYGRDRVPGNKKVMLRINRITRLFG